MQKKLEKLENKINKTLLAIGAWFVALMHKIVPKIVFEKIHQTKLKIKNWYKLKVEQTIAFLIKAKDKIIHYKDVLMVSIDSFQKFPIKEKLLGVTGRFKDVLLKTPFKNHVNWICDKLSVATNRFSTFVNKTGKQQLAIAFTALLMIGVGVLSMYDSSTQIYNTEFQSRAPASAQEYDEKPVYYMYQRKTATVFKVAVPIYRDNVNEIRRVTIDFSVRTSTRFAKKYLEFHTQKLKDFFFTNVEPVQSSFPIEEEGKHVLKEKIHYEVNNFLLREGVEGVVEEVNLVYAEAY